MLTANQKNPPENKSPRLTGDLLVSIVILYVALFTGIQGRRTSERGRQAVVSATFGAPINHLTRFQHVYYSADNNVDFKTILQSNETNFHFLNQIRHASQSVSSSEYVRLKVHISHTNIFHLNSVFCFNDTYNECCTSIQMCILRKVITIFLQLITLIQPSVFTSEIQF